MNDATKLRPEDLTSEERAFNKLTPTQTELLALLSEECGEVVQVIGKILRHGLESCHPNGGPTNRELLAEEIGDCLCASRLLASAGMLNMASVEDRSAAKMEKVFRYLHHARRALFASAPEKAAKVETMADRIAADLKAGTFRGEQPAPPEPAAPAENGKGFVFECYHCGKMVETNSAFSQTEPHDCKPAAREMPEALSKALGRLAYCASSPHETDDWMEETLAIRTALESLWRNLAQADPEYLVAAGKAIAAVRQKAAQPRRMELGKVRAYFNTPFALRTVGDEREALAELDAAEGKGEGRG